MIEYNEQFISDLSKLQAVYDTMAEMLREYTTFAQSEDSRQELDLEVHDEKAMEHLLTKYSEENVKLFMTNASIGMAQIVRKDMTPNGLLQ